MKSIHLSSICPRNCCIRSVFGASSIEGGLPSLSLLVSAGALGAISLRRH